MCRYDDDYAWYVMDVHADYVHDSDRPCADCGRRIPAGEVHVEYVGDTTGGEEDDRDYVFMVSLTEPRRWLDEDDYGTVPMIQVPEDDLDAWEALGFRACEMRSPWQRNENIVYEYQCSQCYEANHWLVEVCHQGTVLVTREDLDSHTDEYDEATLGLHFLAMDRACKNRWRHRNGHTMSPSIVKRLARHAVRHAKLVGMHPA